MIILCLKQKSGSHEHMHIPTTKIHHNGDGAGTRLQSKHATVADECTTWPASPAVLELALQLASRRERQNKVKDTSDQHVYVNAWPTRANLGHRECADDGARLQSRSATFTTPGDPACTIVPASQAALELALSLASRREQRH